MNRLKNLLNFYINSSIHVSLAVVALALVTVVDFDLKPGPGLLMFIFFGSITGYNFVKYAGIAKLHHKRLAPGLRTIQLFSLFSFILLLISCFFVPLEVLFWSGIFALLTLLYALPVFRGGRNLRSISGIKIFIISIVWSGVTVILPVVGAGSDGHSVIVLEFSQRFLLVLVWILPFEIRDLKYDLILLGTIPQKIGVTKTKIFAFFLLLLVVILELFQLPGGGRNDVSLLLICGISAGFIWKTSEKQSYYFSSFWVEGIPILWLLILLVLK